MVISRLLATLVERNSSVGDKSLVHNSQIKCSTWYHIFYKEKLMWATYLQLCLWFSECLYTCI